jgi:ATP-dependent DNA helicase RecG
VARSLVRLREHPVTELAGVGESRANALAKLDVFNILDLLTYYPRRHIDRTKERRIDELDIGESATVLVTVKAVHAMRTRSRKAMVTADVTDGSGFLKVTFFNQPYRERQLKPGMDAVLFGKLELYRGRRQMTNPVVDLVGDKTRRIVPVYPQSEKAGIMSWDIDKWMSEVLRRAGDFVEVVPAPILDRWSLVDRTRAFHDIHQPETMAAAEEARRRLVFDELLRVQLKLVQRKRELERTTPGIVQDVGGHLVRRFHDRLPFPLTGAQERAIGEIEADLAGPHPMHRLLQGDVGSGKTVVAVSALLVAVQGGHQGALMAPTEVLAEQHHLGVRELLAGFTVPDTDDTTLFSTLSEGAADGVLERELRVELLTNRTTAAERRRILAGLADGQVDLAIGTHALIQESIEFRSLGVVVIDEQHRFGVEQRAALRDKSGGQAVPDVLVMTATPIPRTAAMTVYGDLDVSVLDELPPGRTPVVTTWARGELDEAEVWTTVREQVAAGRQAYVVCPLIDESEKLEVRSAEETYERLQAGELSGLRLGRLHGRVTPGEREKAMGLFRSGGLDVLVATTVIEVGVDVPNATVMVILDADRFGIAQLHQLRGRVGRGADQSFCFLVGDATTADGEARLEAMVRTTDGFVLAEVDLDLRGEGTIMGERQKGRNDLKLASLRRDREWVGRAREVAFELVDADPTLADHAELETEVRVLLGDDDTADFLLKS